MTSTRNLRAVVIAAVMIAAALVGYGDIKFAGASSQSTEMKSRLAAAVDAASSEDTTQIYFRPVRGQGRSISDVRLNRYDYDEVERLEKEYQDVSRPDFLRAVFARAVKGHENGSENEKWLAVINYFSRTMRHPPIEQPRYPDGTMVTDPLILLLLHEGRCGHQARVIVDLATVNNYAARLVQLAAHVVAEVKWGSVWHCVDADAGFPADSLRSRFAELPSVEKLARDPNVLDTFAARNWEVGESGHRTVDGMYVPANIWYPGDLLTSSVYFGRQIYTGVFGGRNASKAGITYYYKQGAVAKWENDRYWGWRDLRTEIQPIPMVPVDYAPFRLTITGPAVVASDKGAGAMIPVRWIQTGRSVCDPEQVRNCQLVFDKLGYEVRVSRATRGWDDDFRDYDYMPRSGKGDVLVTRNVRKIDAVTYGIDLPIHETTVLFIEVVPVALDIEHSGEFMWPSNELAVHVVTPRKWTEATP